MKDRSEDAKNNFLAGMNCAQAVLCAFADRCGLDRNTAMKLASGFGGGIARQREVCGAITGMCMAADLIRGVLQHHKELDRRLNECSAHWSTDRMGTVERNILRIAAFEILHRPDVPGPVAINEAVTLAKLFASVESSRFVNGLLDNLLHSVQAGTAAPANPEPPAENA